MNEEEPTIKQELDRERQSILEQIQSWLEVPMVILAFIWLLLLVVELLWGAKAWQSIASWIIWMIFLIDFVLEFSLAPRKLIYLKHNWLTVLALAAPALRIFRVVRILRLARLSRAAGFARGLRLLRVLSSVNRGMRALAAGMQRRGVGYVMLLTLLVTVAGAAGMYSFENNNPDGRNLGSFGTALWWTAMIMTTMGSEFWPQTTEGRILCLFLAAYSFAMFGYVTATLATFFIGRDAKKENKRGTNH
jgi:voltage-gated potassium channel